MNTNLIALGALAVLCGASSGCTAAVYPNGTVLTSYAAPVVVEEPVVVVEPAPVVVEYTRPAPLLPLLVSTPRRPYPARRPVAAPVKPAPAPRVTPNRPTPLGPAVKPQHGGGTHTSLGGGHSSAGGGHSSIGGGRSHHGGSAAGGGQSHGGGHSRGGSSRGGHK